MTNESGKEQLCVVVAMIKDNKGKIFMQKRSDRSAPDAYGKWDFPGGKIKHGEHPEDAIVRECLEEIGCKIKPIRMLSEIKSQVWKRTNGTERHCIVLWYEAKLLSGIPKPKIKKVAEVGWFSKSQIRKIKDLPIRGEDKFIYFLDKWKT